MSNSFTQPIMKRNTWNEIDKEESEDLQNEKIKTKGNITLIIAEKAIWFYKPS